jgi:hypothetical protein
LHEKATSFSAWPLSQPRRKALAAVRARAFSPGLVSEKKLTDTAKLLERKEAWIDAYRHTPHGQPVNLEGQSK